MEKLEIEGKATKKMLIMCAIISLGLLFAVTVVAVKTYEGIEVKPVITDMEWFTDFTDVCEFVLGNKTWGNYFPFAYVIMSIFTKISLGNFLLVYFVVFSIFILMCFWFCRKFLVGKMKNALMYTCLGVFLFLQFPMLFVFERGNIEIISLAFTFIFYILYKDKKYNAAAVILSLAVSMKLYPALLALLFINKKQWKPFFLCAGLSIGITAISYLCVIDIVGLPHEYAVGFDNFMRIYGKGWMGFQYNHSILFGIHYLLYLFSGRELKEILASSVIDVYTIVILIVAVIILLYLMKKKLSDWRTTTVLTLMMVSFPHVSFDYTLIFMIIPIMDFVASDNTKNWEDIVYSMLFGFLLIPMNLREEILIEWVSPNIGLLIRPIIIITIMSLILFTSKKEQIHT